MANSNETIDPADTRREVDLVIHAVRESLTDNIVERFATTASNTLAIVDRLNDEDTSEAIHSIIDRITEFHRLGALDTLFESVLALHAVREALTDNMVERGVMFLERAVNTIGSDGLLDCIEDILTALEKASEKSSADTGGGAISTFWFLLKPESQKSIRFLLNFGGEFTRERDGGNA